MSERIEYRHEIDMQAMVDELAERVQRRVDQAALDKAAGTLAEYGYVKERTCEYVIEDNMNESEGMGDVWFRCTNCGTCYDYLADDWLLEMPHCPKCGATVKGVR